MTTNRAIPIPAAELTQLASEHVALVAKLEKMQRERDAEIYRSAAERIANRQRTRYGCLNSCCMIDEISRCSNSDATRRYQHLFRPKGNTRLWWASGWKPHIHVCRVLALCFAAAMAEAGDL